MTNFWVSFILIIVSLSAGYAYRLSVLSRDPQGAGKLRLIATAIQKLVVVVITPVILINAFWVLDISGGTMVLYPFIGLMSHVIGGVIALAISRQFGHTRRQTGAMFTCGAFTNLSSFGGLVAYMYYGEAGFALSVLFKLFEPVAYYGIGFPLAKLYSENVSNNGTIKWRIDLKALLRDRLVLLPLIAILLGMLLNWSGLDRPYFLDTLVSPMVMLSTVMMLLSVGLNMRLAAASGYFREAMALASIKHLLMPVLMTATGLALGYGKIDGGLPLRVLITMGAMPVAFNSLIPPSIYNLDIDLANSCWIVSTALFVIVILPLLYLLTLAG